VTKKIGKAVRTRRKPAASDTDIGDGDVALVCGKDAEGIYILRRRSQESPIEAGLLRPMREGRPIVGEVVSLKARADLPMVFDVKSEFSTTPIAALPPSQDGENAENAENTYEGGDRSDRTGGRMPGDRPALVTNAAYRKGWDAVWGRRRDRSLN
jgi:hypothetical protein